MHDRASSPTGSPTAATPSPWLLAFRSNFTLTFAIMLGRISLSTLWLKVILGFTNESGCD